MEEKNPATETILEDITFHGGFVRNRGEGRGVRVARAKVAELPTGEPGAAIENQAKLNRNKRPESFPSGSSPLKERKTHLACLGIPSRVLDSGDPEYARCVRQANAYKKSRQKELYLAHGYVSTGVGALLASASLALSASRYLYETATNTEFAPEDRGATNRAAMLKLASSLGDSARQNELAAWELCAREGVVRKRNESSNVQVPWQVQSNVQVSDSGQVKRGPGRPRKIVLALEEVNKERIENAWTDPDTSAGRSEETAESPTSTTSTGYEDGQRPD